MSVKISEPRRAERAPRRCSCVAWSFGMAVTAALLVGCSGESEPGGGAESPAVVVQAVTLRPTTLPRTLTAVGSLESPQTTEVAAELEGKVVFLDVPEGTRVEAGHVLARLDEAEAKAAVAIAKARHENARATLDRVRKLRAEQVVSEQGLDDAVAELDAAQGQLDEARTRLRKTAIVAPFTGLVGLRQVSLGAYLDAGDAIARLTQADPLHAIFSVPQRHHDQIRVGQRVRGVVGTCGERFTGQITVVEPYVDPATRMVRAQAVVPNPDGGLRPGMATTVKIEIETVASALLIPQEAVLRQGAKTVVFTIGDNQGAESHVVTLGEYFLNDVQVLSGLRAGDVVVASGHQKLRPGARVEPHPYAPLTNPNLQLGAETDGTLCNF